METGRQAHRSRNPAGERDRTGWQPAVWAPSGARACPWRRRGRGAQAGGLEPKFRQGSNPRLWVATAIMTAMRMRTLTTIACHEPWQSKRSPRAANTMMTKAMLSATPAQQRIHDTQTGPALSVSRFPPVGFRTPVGAAGTAAPDDRKKFPPFSVCPRHSSALSGEGGSKLEPARC